MSRIIELGYITVIMTGVMAFAMQGFLASKNLDASNQIVKSKNTTIFMALVVAFNISDFLMVFFGDVLGEQGEAWLLVGENILEVSMAYSIMSVEREYLGEARSRHLPVIFITLASLILWTDTLYTAKIINMTENAYMIAMIFLNSLPLTVFICYAFRYMKAIITTTQGLIIKIYLSVYNVIFVILCVVTTVNTIDTRTSWDYVKYDEEIYIIMWLVFNFFNAFLVWFSCSMVTETEEKTAESIEHRIEKLSEEFGLSGREEEIALLIYSGMNNAEIAEKLFLSTNTVKVHASNLYKKIGASGRLQAVQIIRGELRKKDEKED